MNNNNFKVLLLGFLALLGYIFYSQGGSVYNTKAHLEVINNDNITYYNVSLRAELNIDNLSNFTLIYNGKELPYCFEQPNGECNNKTSNVIWFKLNRLEANQRLDIQIQPTKENKAVNGDKVFLFYDDFNRNESNSVFLSISNQKYQATDNNIRFYAKNGTFYLEMKANGVNAQVWIKNKKFPLNSVFEFRKLNDEGHNKYGGPTIYYFNLKKGEGLAVLSSNNKIFIKELSLTKSTNKWNYINYNGKTTGIFSFSLEDNKLKLNDYTYTSAYEPQNDKVTFGYNLRYVSTAKFDWWRVRTKVNNVDVNVYE